jgi:hypothetical protein
MTLLLVAKTPCKASSFECAANTLFTVYIKFTVSGHLMGLQMVADAHLLVSITPYLKGREPLPPPTSSIACELTRHPVSNLSM